MESVIVISWIKELNNSLHVVKLPIEQRAEIVREIDFWNKVLLGVSW